MVSATENVPTPECTPPLPRPEPIRVVPVHWNVLTAERLPPGDQWVFIALTPKEYESLSKNQAEILRWIEEATARLQYYEGEPDAD